MVMPTSMKTGPAAGRPFWKATALGMLRRRPVGRLASLTTHRLGARELSRKISQISRYVPPIVDVTPPAGRPHRPGFRMHGIGGLDQVARCIWWGGWHGYERPMPDLFLALAREARAVLDVGAYTGFYAMLAAIASPSSSVVAFEPFPPARAWLEKNLALSGLADRVRVVGRAVGDEDGPADFFVPTTETGLLESAASLNPSFRADHLQVIPVPVSRLDDAAAELGVGPIDLMKIDVESFEHRVLRGAPRILAEDRPTIFLEVLGPADVDALEEIRRAFGYRCGVLREDGVRWRDRVAVEPGRPDQVLCHESRLPAFERAASEMVPAAPRPLDP